MSTNLKIGQNTGIISTGDNAKNVIHNNAEDFEKIQWEKLKQEIDALKINSDASIKKFTDEAAEAVEKKDGGKIKQCLIKWMPCIGSFIETSYYLLEIAGKFGALK